MPMAKTIDSVVLHKDELRPKRHMILQSRVLVSSRDILNMSHLQFHQTNGHQTRVGFDQPLGASTFKQENLYLLVTKFCRVVTSESRFRT